MALPPAQRNFEITKALGNNCLVFVGMMGCGKSAIGRLVADSLGLDFKDSDSEIEKSSNNMKVSEIFAEYGESEFRRVEQRVVQRMLSEGPIVLSLGGGAFMNEDTRQTMKDNSTSVWLQADLDVLVSRVSKKPGKRPLLAEGDPEEVLKNLLEERRPIYEQADVIVGSSKGSKNQTRDMVLDGLHGYFCPSFAV